MNTVPYLGVDKPWQERDEGPPPPDLGTLLVVSLLYLACFAAVAYLVDRFMHRNDDDSDPKR